MTYSLSHLWERVLQATRSCRTALPPLAQAAEGGQACGRRRLNRVRPAWKSTRRGCCYGAGCDHRAARSEEHTSELQSRENLVCRLLLEKKKEKTRTP